MAAHLIPTHSILEGNLHTSSYEYRILCTIPSVAAGTAWGSVCGDKVSTQQSEHLSSASGHMHQPAGLDMGPEDQAEHKYLLMVVACSCFPEETCTIGVSLGRAMISQFLKFNYMIKLLNCFCALGHL